MLHDRAQFRKQGLFIYKLPLLGPCWPWKPVWGHGPRLVLRDSITVAYKTLCWVIHDEVAGLYNGKHTHTYAHTHAHAYIYTPYLLAQAA